MNSTVKVLALIGIVVVAVLIAAVVMVLAWSWVVPDVFAGAVAAGVLPATITLGQAIKLSILLGALGIAGRSRSDK